MSCTIFICILIVFLVSYILFFQRLQKVQPPSIPISQIRFPVIGIVYKVQADRHPASTRIPDTAGKHQISVIIIDITRSCPSHILAVVSPVVFQSGIVQISNQYTRTAIFRLDRKIRRHIFGILSILLHCPHHQTAIHSGLIPFFYHTGNGKTLRHAGLRFKNNIVIQIPIHHRLCCPGNFLGFPFPICLGYPHCYIRCPTRIAIYTQSGIHHHIT